jgi:hypothetical protein
MEGRVDNRDAGRDGCATHPAHGPELHKYKTNLPRAISIKGRQEFRTWGLLVPQPPPGCGSHGQGRGKDGQSVLETPSAH